MKTKFPSPVGKRRESGYALVLVVGFAAISLVTLGGLMQWSSTNSRLIARNNEFFSAQAAAEAATEKVLSRITSDFQSGGEAGVYANLPNYRLLVPTPAETVAWDGFEFNNASGEANRTYVARGYANVYTNLDSQYSGLRGMASTYRVVSNAKDTTGFGAMGAIGQEVQIATVPVFQFAMFYNLDMEISCGQAFNVTGRVHSNGHLYVEPDSSLTFQSAVTAVGSIDWGRAPGDSRGSPSGTATYKSDKDSKVTALTLPIGTNNTSDAVHAIIEVPPASESSSSAMGRERLYNKADIIINVTNNAITVTSGPNAATPLSKITTNASTIASVVKTNNTGFKDSREAKTVKPVDINVAALTNFTKLLTSNPSLRTSPSGAGYVVYVNDTRTLGTSMNAVRLTNAATLPTTGVSFATALPLYVQGHYNAPTTIEQGHTNTANTQPSALLADAVTVLSTAWTDANSTSSLSSRSAAPTTVNAAILSGIVETKTYNSYSGGVENFPRFLEDWSPGGTKKDFTYNGSMVVMFASKYAKSKWGQSEVYDPPGRNWAFDVNFMDSTKLPPGTPQVRTLIRGKWQILAAGSTNLVTYN